MILVVDVGNTNINFGVYEGEKMLVMFKRNIYSIYLLIAEIGLMIWI